MENTDNATNVANYFIEQGYTNRGNSILYYSSQYRLEKEEADGSTTEVIFLGNYGNNINKVSKSDTIEIVNKSNIEISDKYVQNFINTYSASNGYTTSTTTFGNRYPKYDGEVTLKKQYDDGTIEEIYFKYKDGKIVSDIECTKTRKVAIDTYYNEIKSELTCGETIDENTGDEYNNEDNTKNVLGLKNAVSLTSSSNASTAFGSKVSLNSETILNKIKIVRNTYGYGNTEELIKVIKNNLELKNKSYKPKEMFASVKTYNYFSNQLDNYLDRIEKVVLQIIAADNGELDYKNNVDTGFNNKLNDVGKQTLSASLLGTLDSDNPETGVDVEENKFYYQDLKIHDSDGNEIGVIQEGKYDIYEIEYDNDGNIIRIRISPNGEKEKWIKVDDLLLENSTVIKFEQIGVYHYDDLAQVMIYDSNGNVIGVLKKGDYSVYDVKYDENGNVIAIRISDAGESEKWVYIYQDGEYIGKYYELTKQGIFIYKDMEVIISDKYGNKIGILEKGSYKIYEFKYDEDGNVIAIRISKDSEEEKWIKVDDLLLENSTVIKFEQIGVYHYDDLAQVMIYDSNGNVIGVLKKGDYSVYDVKYDENGNVIAIRISDAGESEKWVYIYQDGEYIGKYYELTKQGIFIYKDMEVIISDKYGNKIGILEKGSYKIYEFKYDENGNVIAIRISKDSEEEKWIFLKDNNLDISLVSPDIKIVKEVELDENGSKINFFNGKTIAGIIGVLVIAVGTVLYKKYKKNNHEEPVEPGEYNIYDTYLEDDEISEVKVSKPGDEDAWIELE